LGLIDEVLAVGKKFRKKAKKKASTKKKIFGSPDDTSMVGRIKEKIKSPLAEKDTKVFTADELELLRGYKEGTGDSLFVPMMQRFRFGIGSEQVPFVSRILKIEKEFDAIFDKARINKDLTLHRIVSDENKIIAGASKNVKVGDVIPSISIQSTSTSKSVIRNLKPIMGENAWTFTYNAPKGSNVLAIDRVLIANKVKAIRHDEFLINNKQKMKVVKIDKINKTIEFDIINDAKKPISKASVKSKPKPKKKAPKVTESELESMDAWLEGAEPSEDMIRLQRSRSEGTSFVRTFDFITDEEINVMENNFTNLMKKVEIDKTQVVHRVIVDVEGVTTSRIGNLTVGDHIPAAHFQATSKNPGFIKDWAEDRLNNLVTDGTPVTEANLIFFKIKIPKGLNAIDFNDIAEKINKPKLIDPYQQEILLPNEGLMRITRKNIRKDGAKEIELDFIPAKKAKTKGASPNALLGEADVQERIEKTTIKVGKVY